MAGLAGLPDGQLWGRAVCSLLVRVPISDARLPLLYDHRIITLDHGPTPESSREGEGFFIRGIFEDFKIGVRSGFYRDNFS